MQLPLTTRFPIGSSSQQVHAELLQGTWKIPATSVDANGQNELRKLRQLQPVPSFIFKMYSGWGQDLTERLEESPVTSRVLSK
jgi:hypothetical protein